MPEGCNRKYVTGAHVQAQGAEKVNEGLTPAELFKVWAATGMPITLPPEMVQMMASFVQAQDEALDGAEGVLDRAERLSKRTWLLFIITGFMFGSIWSAVAWMMAQ